MASRNTAICQVCFTCYDSEAKRPKILPCGHTFCSQCLLNITERNYGSIVCPLCKRKTVVTDLSQLTTNFSILDLTPDDQQEVQPTSKASARAEQRLPLSAGICDDHGQHKLFKCKSCDKWICHVCTVLEHPLDKCNIISVKKALEEMRNNMNAQFEQIIMEYNQTFNHLGVYSKELQTLEKNYKKMSLEMGHVMRQYEEAEEKVAGEHLKLEKAQKVGLANLQVIKDLQNRMSNLSGIQETEDLSQTVSQYKKSVQTWMPDIQQMRSGQDISLKSQMQSLTNFSMELLNWNTLKNLELDQLQSIIASARESIMLSLITLAKPFILVEKDNQNFYASVSMQDNNTALVGDLYPSKPCSSSTTTIIFMEMLRKIPDIYAVKEAQGQLKYYHLKKIENEDRFTMVPMDDSVTLDRLHLLIPMNTLIQAGVVWVMITKERFGYLMRQDDPECGREPTVNHRYHLHASVDHPPPGESVIFKCNLYEDLISPPLVVFLTLGWHGKTQGDLIIMLEDGSIRSIQFLKLCIRDSEHSYRGTSFLTIGNFGNPGEMVRGGDYDKNDGTGGQSILPNIPRIESNPQPVTEGLLSGMPNKGNGAQFNIYTRTLPGSFDYWSFGRVTTGIEVLKKAVLLSNIQDVKIENCGAVL
ncbi:E3 ubiquitin-protein ligase TRIM7-like [Penaeus monodon]|uniref:E3 ubiquitin-protein ligase TRIM7-like n=1 Tax=Penaeus monodon TaxID=6687 RepID=UPI0018A7867F|nr:E3 ubiquitin-protein ligase TRIM7-like [Penaeus monodon]